MSESVKYNFSKRKDFKKFEVLPAWISILELSNFSKVIQKKIKLKNRRLFYGGNIGKAQSIKTLIKIVAINIKILKKCILFLLVMVINLIQ